MGRSSQTKQAFMKITNILASTQPIKSDIRNAHIDFSKMTLSLVAVSPT
jgi:D(-)-tartrate dehydratase